MGSQKLKLLPLEDFTLEDRSTPAAGLSATYWDNMNFTGTTLSRTDATPHFDWGHNSPDSLLPNSKIAVDTFSAIWTGKVQTIEGGDYMFRTFSDDGVKVFVDNLLVPIISNWTDHAPTFDSAKINLAAGKMYDIRVEYYENSGGAVMQLEWQRPNGSYQIIPTAQLTTPTPLQAPTDVTLSAESMPLGEPVGTFVGNVAAMDPDAGDIHTFTLVPGAGSTNNSQFQIVGSELRTASVFSAPTTTSVRIRATDASGLFFEKAFTVNITSATLNSIHAGHDHIPDFGTNPTVTATRSGNWSDPGMWSTGVIPGTGSIVGIGSGRVVNFDYSYAQASKAPTTVSIKNGGTLAFRTDMNTRLYVSNLQVLSGGTLTVGTAANPVAANVKAEIIIADRPLNLARDPEQFGNGLIALGTVKMHGSAKKVNGNDLGYVKLAVDPLVGHTTLTLAAPVTGWRSGDKLILPDTRQLGTDVGSPSVPYPSRQTETLTISNDADAISTDGLTIKLATALAFDHRGATGVNQTLRSHVGNATRNVVISSENATGTYSGPNGATLSSRGHTFYTTRADVDIRYTEHRDLGRTTNQTLNDVTNRKGRYAAHMHHLYGPVTPPANGRQFTFVGNAMNDVAAPKKWPIAVHDSHYGLVEGTTMYGGTAAGIATEDGNESYNLFKGNFVVGITGDSQIREKERKDLGADGFWLAGPNNELRDNVVAAVARAGYVVFGGSNSSTTSNPVTIPAFQGANPQVNGVAGDTGQMAILGFVNNEAYSSLRGIETWYIGHGDYYDAFPGTVNESLILGGRFWHIFRDVLEGNQQNHFTIDGLVAVNDQSMLGTLSNQSVGLKFGHSQRVVVRNVNIQNFRSGLIPPWKIAPRDYTGAVKVENVIPTRVLNSYFNNAVDVNTTQEETDAYKEIPPAVTIFDNNTTAGTVHFLRGYTLDRHRSVSQLNRVYVLAHNTSLNFQLYGTEQAKTFIMPETRSDYHGAPVAGWTNEQLWNSAYRTVWGYRYAVFGEMIPDGFTALSLPIVGVARPLSAAEVTQIRG
ncbi:MAG: PA14 domain-containing protein [Fimbriiglobus sp.]